MNINSINGTNTLTQSQSIMPQQKSTREIVREEIQRAEKLKKLEEKHKAGEITDFEYMVQKIILNTPTLPKSEPKFSTTA